MEFDLIADFALEVEDEQTYHRICHYCESENVDVYFAPGYLILDSGKPEDVEFSDRQVACKSCLKGGRVMHVGEFQSDPMIEALCTNPVQEKRLLRSTPRIPHLMDSTDWPICCGRLTQYVGRPKTRSELLRITDSCIHWDNGKVSDYKRDFRHQGNPESFSEISRFSCRECEKCYWIDSPS